VVVIVATISYLLWISLSSILYILPILTLWPFSVIASLPACLPCQFTPLFDHG
jgi:hypothetical protein